MYYIHTYIYMYLANVQILENCKTIKWIMPTWFPALIVPESVIVHTQKENIIF